MKVTQPLKIQDYARQVVDNYLAKTNTSPSTFGREVFGDSCFYPRFCEGRITVPTAQKAIDYCTEKLSAQKSMNNEGSQ